MKGLVAAIVCPKCSGQASFSGVFVSPNGEVEPNPAPPDAKERQLRRASVYSYAYSSRHESFEGWVQCGKCGPPFRHVLTWPEDAWFKVGVNGRILWSVDREDALQLLEFISADHRKAVPGARNHQIRKLPRYFQLASHREEAVRKLEALLLGSADRKLKTENRKPK